MAGVEWSQHQLTRRRFLGGMTVTSLAVAGGGLLAACGKPEEVASGGASLQPVTTQLIWIKNVEFAGWWLAQENGFYEEEGVDPSFLPAGDTSVEAIVAGGSAEVGTSAVLSRAIDAIGQGTDFVIFGAQYQDSPDGMLSLPDNPIRRPEDIIGKRIGVQEGVTQEVDAVLKLAGLPVDYEPVRVGFDPDPLIQGDVDGYFCFVINQPITLEKKGIPSVVVSLGELGYRQYGNVMISTREWADENHDALVGYMRATIRGWEANNSDPEQGLQASLKVGKDLGLDEEQQRRENELQIPLMRSDVVAQKGLFWVDKETIAGPMYDALLASGRTDLPDVDEIVDLSILEAVYEGKTTVS
jgi:ABC-type nitrate/sulfonate/bicarbonate transport system substrate-binding protein